MRAFKIFSILALGFLLFTCSEDKAPTGPSQTEKDIFQFAYDAQAEFGDMLNGMLSDGMDTLAALDSVAELISRQQRYIDNVEVNSQGLAILYNNGIRGGIMIDPEDDYSRPYEMVSEKVAGDAGDDFPGSLQTLFLCPIYSERTEIADNTISHAEEHLDPLGYRPFTLLSDHLCMLSNFDDLDLYGVVHIYSFSFAWPQKHEYDEIYLMSGEFAEDSIVSEYQDDLAGQRLALIYLPGRGNMYFLAPSYIDGGPDLSDDEPLVYLDFGHSFRGGWKELFVDQMGAGAVVGYDWNVIADSSLNWAMSFYEKMSGTDDSREADISDWYNSIDSDYPTGDQLHPQAEIKYAVSGNSFSLWKKIVISSIEPELSLPGDTISIHGYGFGDRLPQSHVVLENRQLEVVSWSDSLITAIVPDDAAEGYVHVQVKEMKSNRQPLPFEINPRIDSISPSLQSIGEVVRIDGEDFGRGLGDINVVFGRVLATEILEWHPTMVKVKIPEGASSGPVYIQVNGKRSNYFNYSIEYNLEIHSVSPDLVIPGDTVVIEGINFGNGSDIEVILTDGYLYSIVLDLIKVTDDEIRATVPFGAKSGLIKVSRSLSYALSDEISVLAIYEVDPSYGAPGVEVTVKGSGFGNGRGAAAVMVGGYQPSISSWSEYQIVLTVPDPYPSPDTVLNGGIVVTRGNLQSNRVDFIVPMVDSSRPRFAGPGDTLNIYGASLYKENLEIIFESQVVEQAFYVSDTLVSVIIPDSARSGAVRLQYDRNFNLLANYVSVLRIFSVKPRIASPGEMVVIHGDGFGEDGSNPQVRFDDMYAEILTWDNNSIEVLVPPLIESPEVSVLSNNSISNKYLFWLAGDDNILELLNQCIYADVEFYGYMEFSRQWSPAREKTFTIGAQCSWANQSEFDFPQGYDPDYSTMARLVRGNMSDDGNVIDSLHAYRFDESYMYAPGGYEEYEWFYDFVCSDLSLKSIDIDDSIDVVFEISGPEVQNHIEILELKKIYNYAYIDWDNDYISGSTIQWQYLGTDWYNATYVPKLTVTFRNYIPQ